MAKKSAASSRSEPARRERGQRRSDATASGADANDEANVADARNDAAPTNDATAPLSDERHRDEATRPEAESAARAGATPGETGRAASGGASSAGAADPAALAKMLTPERAVEMYKANAELALEVINAAIEGTSQLRRKQFEGEQEARDFQRRQVRTAARARDAQSLLAAQQGATQEAVERSMRYWGEMFELIVEIQKRLFTLMQEQMQGVPGMRGTRATMGMFPDLGEMQKVISAMQGVLSSGTSTFEAMQRAMTGYGTRGQSRDRSER
jgi:phasin family protein